VRYRTDDLPRLVVDVGRNSDDATVLEDKMQSGVRIHDNSRGAIVSIRPLGAEDRAGPADSPERTIRALATRP
jgi:hypothetical protein